jgi:hypothetical protein
VNFLKPPESQGPSSATGLVRKYFPSNRPWVVQRLLHPSAPAGVGESQGSNSASDSSLSTGCRSAPATAQTIPALTTLYSFTGVNDDGLLPYGTLAIVSSRRNASVRLGLGRLDKPRKGKSPPRRTLRLRVGTKNDDVLANERAGP